MKIAIPLDENHKVYPLNPWTAPIFAIYLVGTKSDKITYECIAEKANPWIEEDESIICDPMMCSDGCSDLVKNDLNHLADHYIVLEAISGCSYLVAETTCSNIEKVLENGGIEIFRLPPIIREPDLAIKRLLVNLDFTSDILKIQKISN